ncbi:hypothetical protein C8J57DRAFT_1529033 [Mycena rebaudengoi]|nr:hypothetical protein C8J57DRAFT_1529033 [Mycena rebaudengoi]
MPTRTDRQLAAAAFGQAFLITLIADIASEDWADDSGSDTDSSDSSESSSSSSSSSEGPEDAEMTPADQYTQDLAVLYGQRYMVDREDIPKSQEFLHLLLYLYKETRPDFFRSYLRIHPDCFDALVTTITDDPVFQNNSNNPQMPVAEQLVIALY